MSGPPNIILCMCDELPFCGVGCYGNPTVRPPHIDRLAAEGVRVEHGISNNPVCLPARSTVLSGQYARTCTGQLGNYNPPGWVDDTVGGMMQALRETGLDDNTLVLFTSDHGDMLGSHGKFFKGDVRDESARVPMIFWHPRLLSPRVADDGVLSLIDVCPTLTEAAGLQPADSVQGRSGWRWLASGDDAPQAVYLENKHGERAVRTPRYLYSLRVDRTDRQEKTIDPCSRFFDRANDPYQMHHLGDEADGPIGTELRQQVERWTRHTQWATDARGD